MSPTGPVLVIADDLTGANASGALLAELGLRVLTVTGKARDGALSADHRADVLVVDTASRYLAPGDAAARVRRAIARVPDPVVVSKRIDTTLRGNIGVEVEAALEHLCERHTERWRALVCPAWPDGGRTTVDGTQFIDGVPVTESAVGGDVRGSITSSRVADHLQPTTRPLTAIGLDDIAAGRDRLQRLLADARGIVVCDAVSSADVDAVARAAADVSGLDGSRWLTVDPGPLTASLVRHVLADAPAVRSPVVVVAASATAATQRQLDQLEEVRGAKLVVFEPADDDVAGLAARLGRLVAGSDGAPVGVRVAPTGAAEANPSEADALAGRMARALRLAAEQHRPGGLYLTGGDTATAVVDALGAVAIEVEDQIFPLAVAGHLVGGDFDGLMVITKGGSVGDDHAAVHCTDAITQRSRNAYGPTSREME